MVRKVAAMKVRASLGWLLDQERFQVLDRIKTKARRVPAKQLDGIIDEAVWASRTIR
jgi:hypothetical protein